jgi:hypothetical protein
MVKWTKSAPIQTVSGKRRQTPLLELDAAKIDKKRKLRRCDMPPIREYVNGEDRSPKEKQE